MADDVALLLRRAAFGPTSAELALARKAGYQATVAALVAPPGPDIGGLNAPLPDLGPDPLARLAHPTRAQRAAADAQRAGQALALTRWWLDRLTVADHQAYEKLVFFWHGHWATSIKKVIRAPLLLEQHRRLRGSVDFSVLAHRMVTDPALVYWLDGQLNTKSAPNENLGRELMELFTLGIGHYTERDVKEAGRALTGWKIDYDAAQTYFNPPSHDAGKKTILGSTGHFDARTLVDLLLRQEACPRFLAARLWWRYASSTRPIPRSTREKMVAGFPDTMAMLRLLWTDEAFQAGAGQLAKQPVEWLAGALRQLRLRPANLPARTVRQLLSGLESMGQLPFAPPSVAGWPAGNAWLTAGAARVRLSLAGLLAQLADPGRLTPEALADLLAVGTWTDRTYSLLKGVADPRHLLTLGLVSPDYLAT